MKAPPVKSLIGEAWAEAQIDQRLLHAAKVKAERQLFGAMRTERRPGKRWRDFELIKLAEIELGYGGVRLDHFVVSGAIEDAIKANDWHFLYLLSRWHEEERKAVEPDPLSEYMRKNWKACSTATGGWKGLRDLDDPGIALWAKKQKVRNRAFGKM